MDLLREPGAVDELGIGIIRDAFANRFFPGTSTIQTRAKYFLIVPYLLYELENDNQILPAYKMLEQLEKEELDFIEVLKKSGELGVIGATAGKNLRRKPSNIYWNGIKTYEIFRGPNMSLSDYARTVYKVKTEKRHAKSQTNIKNKNEDGSGDDQDVISSEFADGFWRVLPEEDWREDLTIHLTSNEAQFLRERIINSCQETLIGFILEENLNWFCQLENFDALEALINKFPENIASDYLQAKKFADFVIGAHIRFNVILSKGESDKINLLWEEWFAEADNYADVDLMGIFDNLNIRNNMLKRFLIECKNAMLDNDLGRLDQLIIQRERRLKGDARSKLYNASDFTYEGWVGINKLQYRMQITQTILNDIFTGLGDNNA